MILNNKVEFVNDRNGKPEAAVSFNNYYLDLPSAVYFTGDYTTALWMYPFKVNDWQAVYMIQSYFFVNIFALIINSEDFLQVELGTNVHEINFFIYPTTIPYNKWTHVGVTLKGTRLSCYTNGLLAGSQRLMFPKINTVMRSESSFGSPDYRYNGYLDEVFFYNRALSATEMASILTFNEKRL